MGMLGEFLRYAYDLVSGRGDRLAEFIDPLTMAERYLRWGQQSGDLRDFRAGLEQLRLCVDADAPLAVLLVRKYSCLLDLARAGVDGLLTRHENGLREEERRETEIRYERDGLRQGLEDLAALVARLKADGSLLKAKEQERIIAEQRSRLAALEQRLAGLEERGDLCDSYDATVADCEKFFQHLDQAQLTLSVCPKLSPQARQSLARQLAEHLEQARLRINRLDPTGREAASAPPATPPYPA